MLDPRIADAEWLETNGAGSYASSTVCGRNDRRYHGLLVAALRPPVARHVLLSKIDEEVDVGGAKAELGTNAYSGAVHPDGRSLLADAARDPFPRSVFAAGGARIERTVAMLRGERTVAVRYRLLSGARALVTARPLLAFRGDHALTRENAAFDARLDASPGRVSMRPYEALPRMHLLHEGAEVAAGHGWFRGFEYAIERSRGLDHAEDLHNPAALRFELAPDRPVWIAASVDRDSIAGVPEAAAREAERRRGLAPFGDPAADALAVAADQFLVERGDATSVIAGYPWFVDWGRDAMIALPGLALATGRSDEARGVLRAFARAARDGMLPNRFADDAGEPEFNTVDATLWMFEAAGQLFDRGGEDARFVADELYGALVAATAAHERGGPHGIALDADGFVRAGEPALTWMDARVGGAAMTPRVGRPVEIQALWWNAMRRLAAVAGKRRDRAVEARAEAHAARLAERFEGAFWVEAIPGLADVLLDGGGVDASLRPNAVIALSVAAPLLEPARARAMLERARAALVTPAGLRTLAPDDPAYCRRYAGGPAERDRAYHQGTVWPWLLGPFARAWRAAFGDATAAHAFLEPSLRAAAEPFPGTVAEVADGDPPHFSGGCLAQAWSVAELLRATVELRSLRPSRRRARGAGGAVSRAAGKR